MSSKKFKKVNENKPKEVQEVKIKKEPVLNERQKKARRNTRIAMVAAIVMIVTTVAGTVMSLLR